jgi:RimJ/RimL family protein N-acetyltransferase
VTDRPLYAYVHEDNLGSIRVLQKAGFSPAGKESDHLILQMTI